MRRFLAITFLALLTLASCSKESNQKALLEGTWGLVHYDYTTNTDGTQNTRSTDYDPYNPVSSDDGKVALLNTQGNTFLMTFYVWDVTNKEWVAATKYSVEYRSNQLYYAETKRSIDITSLTSTQLILEAPVYSYPQETQTIIGHSRMVFRKMKNVGE